LFSRKQASREENTRTRFFALVTLWPWPDDLHIRMWPEDSEDVPGIPKTTSLGQGLQKLEHYTTDRQTDRHTDTQTDATERSTTPHSRVVINNFR